MTNPEYSKGYAAGRRRKQQELSDARKRAKDDAFKDRVFMAMIPIVFANDFSWGGGAVGTPERVEYTSCEQRIDFAYRVADLALKRRGW